MKNLVRALAAFIVLTTASPAGAFEVRRNGTTYNVDMRVTNGGKFTKQGVDRKFDIPGSSISGKFRLIQDNYSECATLVTERRSGQAKNGFTRLLNSHTAGKQCVVSLANPSTRMEMTSYYIRLDACKCFSALHFIYPESEALLFEAAGGTMVRQLQSLSKKTKRTGAQDVASSSQSDWEDLDSNWREGVRILHKRRFTPEMVVAIGGNFFGDALAQGITDQRLPGARGYDYIASVYGIRKEDSGSYRFVRNSRQRIPSPDLAFDLQSGRAFWKKGVTPQQMAKSISVCYRSMDYRTKCRLNFHSQMGCRMTDTWKRFCRKAATDKAFAEYGDLCFWTPKGDLPIMPAAESTEKTVMFPPVGERYATQVKKTGTKKKNATPLCGDQLLSRYEGRF